MANAGLAWVNHLMTAVLATNSEVATLPVSNIKDLHGATVWRTQAATGIEVTADLGAAQPVSVMAVAGAQVSAALQWRLRLSTTDAHDGDLYDSGLIAADPAEIVKARWQALLLLPTIVTARYIKINLEDSGRVGVGSIDIGHLWLADLWQPRRNFSYGAQNITIDPTQKSKSIGGQNYSDIRNKFRAERFEFNFLGEDEVVEIISDQLDAVAGISGNILYIKSPGGERQNRQMIIGQMSELGANEHTTHPAHARAFEISEAL
nr:hypothetical protein [uncultured Dongia sp.]